MDEIQNTRKYRLLVVAPQGIHLRNFLRRIESETSAVHLITTEKSGTDYDETLLDFSFKQLQNFWKTPRAIRAVAKTFKPDVVHVHQLNSISYFAVNGMKGLGIPVCATAWGSDVLVNPEKSSTHKRILRYVLNQADAFTADSKEVAEKMKSMVKKELRISLCNYGADKPSISMPKENIIYSNRLHDPLYRIDKVIRAFAKINQQGDQGTWKLIIAGTGSQSNSLKSLVSELGIAQHVEFQGWVQKEQNERNYARAKVWVSIPESDATPISLLEAMYHGCYPIVSDLSSLREWITESENGTLVRNVDEPFFDGVLNEINPEIATSNRELVEAKGSGKAAALCFSRLHRSLISTAN